MQTSLTKEATEAGGVTEHHPQCGGIVIQTVTRFAGAKSIPVLTHLFSSAPQTETAEVL